MKRAAISSTGEAKGPPRNRRLFDQGQLARAEIRSLLESHPPLAPPLTGKDIQRQLTRRLSERRIQELSRAIRAEYTAFAALHTMPTLIHAETHGNSVCITNRSVYSESPETRLFDRGS